jgi:hypothetical protein
MNRKQYQEETRERLLSSIVRSIPTTLEAGIELAYLMAYEKLLQKTEANIKQLDFINKEITNYNMRIK